MESESIRPESESTALESKSTEVESESTRVESESGLAPTLGSIDIPIEVLLTLLTLIRPY